MTRNMAIFLWISTGVTLIGFTIIVLALITVYSNGSVQNVYQEDWESAINQLISKNLSQKIQIIEQENQIYINWRVLSYEEFSSMMGTFDTYQNKHFILSFESMLIDNRVVEQLMTLEDVHSVLFTNCEFCIREGLECEIQRLIFSDMILDSETVSHFTLKNEGELLFRNCEISRNAFAALVKNSSSLMNLCLHTSDTKSLLPVVMEMKELRLLFLYGENIDSTNQKQLITTLPNTQIWLNGEEISKRE